MENKKELFKALANFQQECPVIEKETQGYGYKYTALPQIFEIINPLLKKHGLGFTQPFNNKSITTIIFHVETGQSIESVLDIPQGVSLKGMNDFQVLGSGITYLRRYSLASTLGLVTDKDIDASGKQTSVTSAMLQKLYDEKVDKIPVEHTSHIERIIENEETKSFTKTYNYLNKL